MPYFHAMFSFRYLYNVKGDPDITPGEFAQLRRIYGGDPFPMMASFEVMSTVVYFVLLLKALKLNRIDTVYIFLYKVKCERCRYIFSVPYLVSLK